MIFLKKLKFKTAAVSILIALAVGGLSSILTRGSMAEYEAASKPALAPGPVVFPIVWSVLFILMGLAAALVYASGARDRGGALTLYAVQLAVNFAWPLIFFGLGRYLLAFFWLVLLFLLVLATFFRFRKIRPVSAYLLLPYLLWLAFAGYLNLAVWYLNK